LGNVTAGRPGEKRSAAFRASNRISAADGIAAVEVTARTLTSVVNVPPPPTVSGPVNVFAPRGKGSR